MDGFSSKANVVVIAATNRRQDLDVALLRPGRFDWEIHFPYPNESDREDILVKTARRLQTREPLPHDAIAKKTEGWSAAELAAILTEAALLAVEDGRREIGEEDYIGGCQIGFDSEKTAERMKTPVASGGSLCTSMTFLFSAFLPRRRAVSL